MYDVIVVGARCAGASTRSAAWGLLDPVATDQWMADRYFFLLAGACTFDDFFTDTFFSTAIPI
ncbi:MAG TPA: hypothetical protein VGB75_00030 [Jatrophihabitans sp.]|jgi:hypothetical protein|uniref:hypothetical protein n=1 Tax=Jatrophihabitans sp. TaxID=1932789 RepID=UPI002EE8D524